MQIVQFIHPGHEYPVSEVNSEKREDGKFDVSWSVGPSHHRRLVRHHGSYIDNDDVQQNGELAFWTEWEGPTTAVKIAGATGRIFAHYAHEVRYPKVPDGASSAHGCCQDGSCGCSEDDEPINTDPCVFGSSFKYALCQQSENGVLRHLDDGSLIAFVSRISGIYYLDTVFVVGAERVDYTTGNASNINCSEQYRALTLDRIPCGLNYTFYRGKQFANMQEVPFSFVPAREWSAELDVGERCRLDVAAINGVAGINVFGTELKQKFKTTNAGPDLVRNVWNEIVRQVRTNGFMLGIHFEMPNAKII